MLVLVLISIVVSFVGIIIHIVRCLINFFVIHNDCIISGALCVLHHPGRGALHHVQRPAQGRSWLPGVTCHLNIFLMFRFKSIGKYLQRFATARNIISVFQVAFVYYFLYFSLSHLDCVSDFPSTSKQPRAPQLRSQLLHLLSLQVFPSNVDFQRLDNIVWLSNSDT